MSTLEGAMEQGGRRAAGTPASSSGPEGGVRLTLEFLRLALEVTQQHGAELKAFLSGAMLAAQRGGGRVDEGVLTVEALAGNLRSLLEKARQQAHETVPVGSRMSVSPPFKSSVEPSLLLPASSTETSLATTTISPAHLEILGSRAVKRGRSSSSSTRTQRSGSSAGFIERIPGLSRHRPAAGQCGQILYNADLLTYMFQFLVGPTAEARPVLSSLSLVCRKWRDLSRQDDFWRPIAKECFPVLAESTRIEGVDTTYRAYLLKYGRDLVDRRVWLGDEWAEYLRLSFEVFDQHDGLRLLSATGSLGIYIDEADGVTALEVKGASRKEVAGPAFSAASRDPRNASISEYFETAYRDDRPSSICVRVTVWDERTGRSGTIWSSSKHLPFLTAAPNHHWQQALPPDSLVVVPRGWTSLVSPATQPVYLQAQVLFHIRPEPDQGEDVAPQHRLYRLAVAGPGSPDAGPPRSCIELVLSTANRVVLGNYIRSILA